MCYKMADEKNLPYSVPQQYVNYKSTDVAYYDEYGIHNYTEFVNI